MEVKAFCNIDIYNRETQLTTEGVNLMRYLFGTNEGEVYLVVFYLDKQFLVNSLEQIIKQDANQASQFMVIEFMASKLSPCSTISYVDDGHFYYGSLKGDSYLIKLMTENSGSEDRPYIQIVKTFTSIAPVKDLVFKKEETLKGL